MHYPKTRRNLFKNLKDDQFKEAFNLKLDKQADTCIQNLNIKTKGGVLDVKFIKNNNRYEKIILSGNVELIFEGEIDM